MSLFDAMETGLNGVQSTSSMGGRDGNVLLLTGSYMNAPLQDVHGDVMLMFAQANVDTPGGSRHTGTERVTECNQTPSASPVLLPHAKWG